MLSCLDASAWLEGGSTLANDALDSSYRANRRTPAIAARNNFSTSPDKTDSYTGPFSSPSKPVSEIAVAAMAALNGSTKSLD